MNQHGMLTYSDNSSVIDNEKLMDNMNQCEKPANQTDKMNG